MSKPTRHTVIPRVMCLVFHQDQILLIKGADHKEWVGKINPIGGHIEKGEDIVVAANREIMEESGLKPTNTKVCGVVHVDNFYGKQILMFVTKSTTDTKKVTSNHEGELEWVNISKLHTQEIFDDVIPIIDHVLSDTTFFTAKSRFSDQNQLIELEINSQFIRLE